MNDDSTFSNVANNGEMCMLGQAILKETVAKCKCLAKRCWKRREPCSKNSNHSLVNMSATHGSRHHGVVNFARMSNQILAENLSRLVKNAKFYGGVAKAKMQDAVFAVRHFQILLLDGLATTGRHGGEATQDFMMVVLFESCTLNRELTRVI